VSCLSIGVATRQLNSPNWLKLAKLMHKQSGLARKISKIRIVYNYKTLVIDNRANLRVKLFVAIFLFYIVVGQII